MAEEKIEKPEAPEKTEQAEVESMGAQWLSGHWEVVSWAAYAVFYLVCVGFFVNGLKEFASGAYDPFGRGDSMWFYFVVSTICLAVASLNVALLHGTARSVVALVVIGVGAYAVPYSLYAFGGSVNTAAIGGVAYLIAMIAITPHFVGLTALICGIVFAVAQKKYYTGLTEVTTADISKITAAYIGLAAIAFCWRLLLLKLYDLFLTAYIKEDIVSDQIKESEGKLEELSQENTLLRNEVVTHIAEIDKIIESKR